MSTDTETPAAPDEPRFKEPQATAPTAQTEAAPQPTAEPAPAVVSLRLTDERAEDLRGAAEEAREAAARLELAAEQVPSLGRTLLNGAAWAATVFLVGWGLNKLASMADAARHNSERLQRGTEDADTEPMPTAQPTPREAGLGGAAATAVLVLMLVLTSGCALRHVHPTPMQGSATCAQWKSAQAGWEWVDTYVRQVLEQGEQAACVAPPLPPPPAQHSTPHSPVEQRSNTHVEHAPAEQHSPGPCCAVLRVPTPAGPPSGNLQALWRPGDVDRGAPATQPRAHQGTGRPADGQGRGGARTVGEVKGAPRLSAQAVGSTL